MLARMFLSIKIALYVMLDAWQLLLDINHRRMLVLFEEHSAIVANGWAALEEATIVSLVVKLRVLGKQLSLLNCLCLNHLLMGILAYETLQRCDCTHLNNAIHNTSIVHDGRCWHRSCYESVEGVALGEEKWAYIVFASSDWVKDLVLVVTRVCVNVEINLSSSIINFVEALIQILCLKLFFPV